MGAAIDLHMVTPRRGHASWRGPFAEVGSVEVNRTGGPSIFAEMDLEDLVDLEARIAADESADPHALRARDHAAFARIESPSSDRHRLLSQWLGVLSKPEEPSLGRRVATGFRLLKLVLILLGLAIGWSTAAFLLHYDGSEPINVATFLLVIVGVQVALLALLVAAGVAKTA